VKNRKCWKEVEEKEEEEEGGKEEEDLFWKRSSSKRAHCCIYSVPGERALSLNNEKLKGIGEKFQPSTYENEKKSPSRKTFISSHC
jgi:hypothetical protein